MGVKVFTHASDFRLACKQVRRAGNTLSLVPTMGALHAGHAALIRTAASLASHVAVSIFVNPTQFGPNEDFSQYPRILDKDIECCETAGAVLVFAPSALEMYPAGESTRVSVAGLTAGLCGTSRPRHFDGVATIVCKLFVLAGTCTAVFGKKDYQQLKVIERLAKDLLLPVRIVGHAIIREPDGLALSSRNAYLSEQERAQALGIVRGLSSAFRAFEAGARQPKSLIEAAAAELDRHVLVPQYVSLVDADTLEPLGDRPVTERALLAVAALCGRTRLIDNIVLGEDSDPLRRRTREI
jgi:pantoate--beta-alanine ligase